MPTSVKAHRWPSHLLALILLSEMDHKLGAQRGYTIAEGMVEFFQQNTGSICTGAESQQKISFVIIFCTITWRLVVVLPHTTHDTFLHT